jgi:hypothetical protein
VTFSGSNNTVTIPAGTAPPTVISGGTGNRVVSVPASE